MKSICEETLWSEANYRFAERNTKVSERKNARERIFSWMKSICEETLWSGANYRFAERNTKVSERKNARERNFSWLCHTVRQFFFGR